MSYLARLAVELAFGAAGIPPERKKRHRRFVLGTQNPDGGFANREGQSDAYYTGFALRGLILLGGVPKTAADAVRGFMSEQLASSPEPIDFLSLVFCDLILQATDGRSVFDSDDARRDAFDQTVAPLARADGSYAKTARSKDGSLYNTFLIVACGEQLGVPRPDPEAIRTFVRSRLREDGGFAEAARIRAGGVNPTGAAIGLLDILGESESEPEADLDLRRVAADFLHAMWTSEGGLKAAGRIPFADLLSTFTGLVALRHLTVSKSIDRAALHRFVDSLECPDGGFRAGTWDETPDVEYTFYGLGVSALNRS